jgi:transposase
MQQLILPIIPPGASKISDLVSVFKDNDYWTYYYGVHSIYQHRAEDLKMFRMVTSMMIDSGACRHSEVIKAFGVPKASVNKALKKYRQGGIEAFFTKKRERSRRGNVLTPEVIAKAQKLLDEGESRQDIIKEIGVKYDTLRKAIKDRRLRESQKIEEDRVVTNKSTRSEADRSVEDLMGTACTRIGERVCAAFGRCNGADVRFEASLDVPNGGVLCALPALLLNGLLEGVEQLLGKIKGYYTIIQIMLLMAFMSLCRIKTVERLRGKAPGEFGKILGLDRIPEVRCLREKLDAISDGDGAEKWAAHLCKIWIEKDYEMVGTLYIDGHVRVYHGKLAKLPRRYVSRERLCLRGTTDYWVNDALGRPFFMIEKAIDPGMLGVLEEDIVPRLLKDIPNQPDDKAFEEDPYLCRFILVFDRQGYSPAFFHKMWRNHRISCLTYHKFPDKPWPLEWFTKQTVTMPNGETVTMNLAEMGSYVGSGGNALWVREVRKLTESSHQTSMISTVYDAPHTQLAARMFSRWCQENFFKYMKEHFEIDMLSEYGVVDFPDTEKVVNPAFRRLDRLRNQLQSKLQYRRARFAELTINPETDNDSQKYQKWLKKKSDLLEEIDQYQHQLDTLKIEIKNTKKHIEWGELENKDKFYRLIPGRKRLMDTIRMVAYRAETAMAQLLISPTVDMSDARQLLQNLFVTEADILPDAENHRLFVRIHNASTPTANRSLSVLLEKLNEAEIKYPGTDMLIVYELVGQKK